MARPSTSKTTPPIAVPHLNLRSQVLEPEPEVSTPPPEGVKRGARTALLGLGLLLVLGGGGFFAWQHFMVAPAVPPPAKTKASPAAPKATPTASTPPPANAPGPTPSDTLNKLAHAPANAINKAQEALEKRRASGQTRVDAASVGEDPPAKPSGPGRATPSKSATTTTTTAMTSVAPGLSASTQVEAAAEASPAFRSFVANAKVSGVFQGNPARAVINGRLTRSGESVEATLGIVFDGINPELRTLVFKDKTGAIVVRKF